jgi:hypothetical protein
MAASIQLSNTNTIVEIRIGEKKNRKRIGYREAGRLEEIV